MASGARRSSVSVGMLERRADSPARASRSSICLRRRTLVGSQFPARVVPVSRRADHRDLGPWLRSDPGATLPRMSTEGRIKELEAKIDKLQAKQADLNKQLAQAEIDQWQGRIEDLELQVHLEAMETNDKLRGLLDQLQRRWADATA